MNPIAIRNKDGVECFSTLKNVFSDFYKSGVNYFETLVETPLKKMIFEEFATEEGRSLLLSHKVADKIVHRYFDMRDYKEHNDPVRKKNLKWRLEMLQLVFKTGLVLLAASDPSYLEEHNVNLLDDTEALFHDYPFLADELNQQTDKKELNYLLQFLNFIRIAMPIIPAASNKHLLLKIVERLEGSNQHYVTGGGMKPATRRRMRLIEEEGNAPAVRRVNRKKNNKRPSQAMSSGRGSANSSAHSNSSGEEPEEPKFKPRKTSRRLAGASVDDSIVSDAFNLNLDKPAGYSRDVTVSDAFNLNLDKPPGYSRDVSVSDAFNLNLDKPPGYSRDVSLKFSVDFEHNIAPVGQALPKHSSHDNSLWSLIEAASIGEGEGSEHQPFGLMPPPSPALTPGSARTRTNSSHRVNEQQTDCSVSVRPVLMRNHSLFTPDLQA